jgi:hypothetical protein
VAYTRIIGLELKKKKKKTSVKLILKRKASGQLLIFVLKKKKKMELFYIRYVIHRIIQIQILS